MLLISKLGDIRRFSSSNKLNAFIGIDLRHCESGEFVAADHISKRGDTFARKLLFRTISNIATAAHYHPNHINDFYQRQKNNLLSLGLRRLPSLRWVACYYESGVYTTSSANHSDYVYNVLALLKKIKWSKPI